MHKLYKIKRAAGPDAYDATRYQLVEVPPPRARAGNRHADTPAFVPLSSPALCALCADRYRR